MARDSGAAACNNLTRCFGPQSVAYIEGMRWGGMRQPWPNACITNLAGITPAVGIGRAEEGDGFERNGRGSGAGA
jgi:hypothetical protein